jgi:D-amino-acid dehydrogenase
MAHIAIVGAGITGVTTAYALLDCGYRVTLFERQRYAAMETSFANGGQLSTSNAEVWNHPSTLAKALGWIFKSDAPLQLNLKPSWHKYSWLAEFVGQVPHYRNNTIDTVRLALEARRQLFAIAEREGIDFDLARRGSAARGPTKRRTPWNIEPRWPEPPCAGKADTAVPFADWSRRRCFLLWLRCRTN